MNLIPAQCPACNANLEIPEGASKVFCMYCGNQLVISNGSDQPEFRVEAGVLRKYAGNSTHVVVPANVREIGEGAFEGAYIDSVVLPEGLMVIAKEAFKNSTLSQVNFPSTLELIDRDAFEGTRLTKVEIPAGMTVRGGAFDGCAKLESITLSPDQAFVADNICRNCTSLKRIVIPAAAEKIYGCAFKGCSSLTEVVFEPESKLDEIDFAAFQGTALTSIDIPVGVKVIGEKAFFDTPLKEFNFPAIDRIPVFSALNGGIERITFHPDCNPADLDFHVNGVNILLTNLSKLREVEFNGAFSKPVVLTNCPSLEKVTGADVTCITLGGTSLQSPYSQQLEREKQERAEEARRQAEEAQRQAIEQQRQREAELKASRRSNNVCQHCGGSFKGLVSKTCTSCGKKKDY